MSNTPRHLEVVEPTFVLRASDPIAQSLVKEWARRHEKMLAKGMRTQGVDADAIRRARDLVPEMERWARQDAIQRYQRVITTLTAPDPRSPAEVIKLPRPTK